MLKSGSAMLAIRAGIANSSVGFVHANCRLGSDLAISLDAAVVDEKKAGGGGD